MPRRLKGVIIILDGLGDRPSAALDGATPLEAAATPNLDWLAANGQCGQVDPFVPGMPVGTHTGTSILMGVAPSDAYHIARGPIEAAGVGVRMKRGDVALRFNFATVKRENERLKILDRRAGRIREGTGELAAALNEIDLGRVVIGVHPATQHRGVIRMSGPNLSQSISDTDPGDAPGARYVLESAALEPGDAAACGTAAALNTFTRRAFEVLRNHPVNLRRRSNDALPATGIIARGAGILRDTPTLNNHLGLRVAVVAGERTLLGLARLYGYTDVTDPKFTALPDTDVEAKVKAVGDALADHDLVYLHVKGTDTLSHDKDPPAKARLIERIDAAITPLLGADLVVGVSADHSTDSMLGRHCGDAVPSIRYAPHGRRDACRSFGESNCMSGGLGRISANAFLLTLLDAMDRLHEYRISDARFLGRI